MAKKEKLTTLELARKAYIDTLKENAPESLMTVAEGLYADALDWGKRMGLFAPVDGANLTKAEQIALILQRSMGNSPRTLKAMAEMASVLLDEPVQTSTCKGTAGNRYLYSTKGKKLPIVPTAPVGSTPIGKVYLVEISQNTRYSYDTSGQTPYTYNQYQNQSRLASLSEIMEFLLEFSANCPENYQELLDLYVT